MAMNKTESFNVPDQASNSKGRLSDASALSTSTPTFNDQSSNMQRRPTAQTMVQVPSALIDINRKHDQRTSIQSEKALINPLIAVPPKITFELPKTSKP